MDKLYAFKRLSPPHSSKLPRIDTQTYVYFMENGEEDQIKLSENELTECKWLTPTQAAESIKLFFPQQFSLIWLSQLKSYKSLKDLIVNHRDKMMVSYMEFRGNAFINNAKLIPEDSKLKTLSDYYKFVFNKNDFLPDKIRKEKHGLLVLSELNEFNLVTGAKEVTELTEKSGSGLFEQLG